MGKAYLFVLKNVPKLKGSFQINLSSDGAETEEKFHQGLIKKAKVCYQEDTELH